MSLPCSLRFTFLFFVFSLVTSGNTATLQELKSSNNQNELHTDGRKAMSTAQLLSSTDNEELPQMTAKMGSLNRMSHLEPQTNEIPTDNKLKCGKRTQVKIKPLSYHPEAHTWIIDDKILAMLKNDVQQIVKCTQINDTIVFDVTKPVKLAYTLRIEWPLTFLGKPRSAPESQIGCTLICPKVGSLVAIWSGHFLMRDITVADCKSRSNVIASSPPPSKAVSAEAYLGKQNIKFENCQFTRNFVGRGLRLLKFTLTQAVAVVFDTVEITDNTCEDFSCITLAPSSTLLNVYLSGNKGGNTNEACGIITVITASDVLIKGMTSENNFWRTVTCEKRTNLIILASTFEDNVLLADKWAKTAFAAGAVIFGAGETSITIKNSKFSNNKARNGGSIHVQEKAKLDVLNTIFRRHDLPEGSGGVVTARYASNFTCNGCTFQSNIHLSTVFYNALLLECNATHGGCIYASHGASVYLTSCRIEDNKATNGSFLYATTGSLITVKKSACRDNHAATDGGAFYITRHSTLKVENTNFDDNVADRHGGGVYCTEGSNCEFRTMSFAHNTANQHGGGICVFNKTTFYAEGCNFGDNSAADGGAAFIKYESNAKFVGGTFINNKAELGGAVDIRNFSDVFFGGGVFGLNSAHRGGAIHALYSYNLTVDRLVFRENHADSGGGAFLVSAFLTIMNTIVQDNVAQVGGGGGIHLVNGTVEAAAVSFRNNHAKTNGGAIFASYCKVFNIAGCGFKKNIARDGGGIAVFNATVQLTAGNTFKENEARHHGGGVFIRDSGTFVESNIFELNTAYSGAGLHSRDGEKITVSKSSFESNNVDEDGGGLFIKRSLDMSVEETEFVENTAEKRGGGLYVEGSTGSLTDLRFSLNTAKQDGGGARVQLTKYEATLLTFQKNKAVNGQGGGLSGLHGKSIRISRCTAKQNSAISGGGLAFKNTHNLYVTKSTVTQNTASDTGGGLYATFRNSETTEFDLGGTRFTNNKAPTGPQCWWKQGKPSGQCPTTNIAI